jgi:hypothetical protein
MTESEYWLCVEFSDFYVNQSLAGQTLVQDIDNYIKLIVNFICCCLEFRTIPSIFTFDIRIFKNYFFIRHCQDLRIFSYVNGF